MRYNKVNNYKYVKERIPDDRLGQFVEDIRADAIDECINEINRECDEQDLYLPIHIRYILEQLKEQK